MIFWKWTKCVMDGVCFLGPKNLWHIGLSKDDHDNNANNNNDNNDNKDNNKDTSNDNNNDTDNNNDNNNDNSESNNHHRPHLLIGNNSKKTPRYGAKVFQTTFQTLQSQDMEHLYLLCAIIRQI